MQRPFLLDDIEIFLVLVADVLDAERGVGHHGKGDPQFRLVVGSDAVLNAYTRQDGGEGVCYEGMLRTSLLGVRREWRVDEGYIRGGHS